MNNQLIYNYSQSPEGNPLKHNYNISIIINTIINNKYINRVADSWLMKIASNSFRSQLNHY